MPFKRIKKRTYGYIKKRRRHLKKKLSPEKRALLKRKILVWGVGAAAFFFLFLTIYIAWISKDLPDPDRLTDREVAQSTKIYDKTGEHLLYEIFADEKRTIIELDEVPKDVINGVIATEDKKFYEHKGIRPLSILRAVATGLFTSKRIAGTSTLTQQLVKNAILTNERSISRKIKEAILSIRLEQKYTKDQILKIYFNEIPYGSTNYGIESAAQSYFGKSAKDLTLAESAALAGIPKAPTTYLNNPDKLKTRRDFVLFRMYEEGFITEEEKINAQAEELELQQRFSDITAPHFVLHVREQLVEEYGETLVDTGGLKVITTLDWDKQEAAQNAVDDLAEDVLVPANANNTSLVSLDPTTGQIVAMIGSKDFFDDDINGKFNVATLGRRQPGSSIKPIIFAAAFEKGFTPNTLLFDVKTDFSAGGRPYMPLNYDLKEHGPVTMRKALQGSLNIPSVKTLYLTGVEKAIEFTTKLGYEKFDKDNVGLSLVLGGGEVNMIEHAAAFGVFANKGVKHDEIISILKVEDKDGTTLHEWKKKKGKQVIKPELAAQISQVMSDDAARAYAFGTGSVLTLPGRPVAAKTGTTNGYVDAWTVGYTPQLVTVVWAGNTDNKAMKRGYGGSRVAGPIWNRYMREALKNEPVLAFPAAPTTETNKAVLNGTDGSVTVQVNKVTQKLATSSTPEKYIVERTYLLPHSILHYVDKNDPQGDVPGNPGKDPQYSTWEASITDWITRKQEEDPDWEVSFEEPPADYDDAYSIELIPTIEIVYPQPNEIIEGRQIDTDIRVSAPRGVTRVKYQIDGIYVGVIEDHPFNLNYYAETLEPGEHDLQITVEDDVGNQLQETVRFRLEADNVQPNVTFHNAPKTASTSDFPLNLVLRPTKVDQIEKIEVFYQSANKEFEGNIATLTDFENLFDNKILFKWNEAPIVDTWQLKTKLTLKNGEVVTGGGLIINVK